MTILLDDDDDDDGDEWWLLFYGNFYAHDRLNGTNDLQR